jgi:hypothetical protein
MQEQEHYGEERQQPASSAMQDEHVRSFQEVVYPPPRWQRVLFSMQRVLVSTFQFIWQRLLPAASQFILGIGLGLTLVWTLLINGGSSQACLTLLGLCMASLPCMCFPKTRFFGLGLLACIFALPVIISISCSVSRHRGMSPVPSR